MHLKKLSNIYIHTCLVLHTYISDTHYNCSADYVGYEVKIKWSYLHLMHETFQIIAQPRTLVSPGVGFINTLVLYFPLLYSTLSLSLLW